MTISSLRAWTRAAHGLEMGREADGRFRDWLAVHLRVSSASAASRASTIFFFYMFDRTHAFDNLGLMAKRRVAQLFVEQRRSRVRTVSLFR